MSFPRGQLVAALLSLLTPALAQDAITLTPAAQAAQATGISQIAGPGFVGMGIEPSNLFSFTGGESPNELSLNLIENLGNYSGAPPHFRIGGNTEDNMIFDENYSNWDLNYDANANGTGVNPSNEFTYGPTYYEALDRFPKGTPITYGLNGAYEQADYLENIVKQANAVFDGLKNVNVVSFEIGNEPDLWLQNQFRSGTWDGMTYQQQFLERANAVAQQVLSQRGINATFFEAPATASTIGTTFAINDLVQNGLTAEHNGSKYISSWNEHDYYYFVGVTGYPLTLEMLLNIDTTESQFAYWAKQVQVAQGTGLPYALREMAAVGPIGLQNISDTFGAALWTLNFFMYAATLNISSVEFHMTDNSFGSPWQPITMYGKSAHVRPSYYAFAAMAQLIGAANGTMQTASLNIQPHNSNARAYATYANGNFDSIVLLNTNQANSTNTNKGSQNFTLSLPDLQGKTLHLSYLTADGSDSTTNTTWNGISFEQSGFGQPQTVDKTDHTIDIDSNGGVTIPVRDSQAVIAHVGSKLGSQSVKGVSGGNSGSGSGSGDDAQHNAASASRGPSSSTAISSSIGTMMSATASVTGAGSSASATVSQAAQSAAAWLRTDYLGMYAVMVAVALSMFLG